MALDQEPECNELLKMLISGDERTSDIRTLLRHHQVRAMNNGVFETSGSTHLTAGSTYFAEQHCFGEWSIV